MGGDVSGNESQNETKGQREEDEAKQKQMAVARVSMWMQRGGCPHMVESTALLTAAMLGERERERETGGDGEGDGDDGWTGGSRGLAVRAAYSAAFSRWVLIFL